MTAFSLNQHYDAPAAEVWALIGDFYAVEKWMPGVAGVLKNEDRQTRVITMHDGARLVERLMEEGPLFHHYRFDDPGPVPVRDFTARLTVTALGPDRSEIDWAAEFEPAPGVAEETATTAMAGFYQACLDKVAAELGA
ncbi:SRPBCC family protein [Streptomyces gibsoniae]|uniref:SRPBCC family protein n=1 Tax=Streptomyces gibsoniae TaxID=3075529 RepID=A0ABU2TMM1_9ACTN|nr:SRPBCC family protein [Streptomyces sp. DSM 41699]MDT0462165.1 SRPBCC family protein [Streptomyces sp. DSM 41699]